MYVYAVHDEFSRDLEDEKKELADAYIRDYSELLPDTANAGIL